MKNLFLVLIVFFTFSCKDNSEGKKDSKDFSTENIDKNFKDISKLKVPIYNFSQLEPLLNKNNDTTYVINFWATWCKPCIAELPAFEKLNSDYTNKKLKVILVSLDFPENMEKQVLPFIEKQKIKSEVILLDDPDANNWIPKVSEEWSGAIPATLINHNGKRKFFERSFTFQELEDEVKKVI